MPRTPSSLKKAATAKTPPIKAVSPALSGPFPATRSKATRSRTSEHDLPPAASPPNDLVAKDDNPDSIVTFGKGHKREVIEEKTESVDNGTRTTRTITTTDVNKEGFEVTSIQTIVTETVTITHTSTKVSLETKIRKLPFVALEREASGGRPAKKVKHNPPTTATHRVILDKDMYPHLFEAIVRHAPPRSLLKLRGTSKAVQTMVDDLLFRHIIVAHGALRPRYGKVWFDHDDPRATKAVAFDLSTRYDDHSPIRRVAPLLKQLRLIRTSDLSAFSLRGPQKAITALAEGKELDVWHVTFADLTTQRRRGTCPWKAVNTAQIQNWVLNITYDPTHQEFPEKGLGEIRPPKNKTVYIVFTKFKRDDTDWQNTLANDKPPVRPRLLNTLLQSLVVDYSTRVCLVGVESWNQEWLNRKFVIYRDELQEDTPHDADIKARLQWWIDELDDYRGEGDCNISFISLDDFRDRVPTQEMYELIMSL